MVLDGVNDVGHLSPVDFISTVDDVAEVQGVTKLMVKLLLVTESLRELHRSHGREFVVSDGEGALFAVDFVDLSIFGCEQIKAEKVLFFGGV